MSLTGRSTERIHGHPLARLGRKNASGAPQARPEPVNTPAGSAYLPAGRPGGGDVGRQDLDRHVPVTANDGRE